MREKLPVKKGAGVFFVDADALPSVRDKKMPSSAGVKRLPAAVAHVVHRVPRALSALSAVSILFCDHAADERVGSGQNAIAATAVACAHAGNHGVIRRHISTRLLSTRTCGHPAVPKAPHPTPTPFR